MKLPNDYTRCRGRDCDRRAECARYRCWPHGAAYVPVANRMCEPGAEAEHFILYRGPDDGQAA